MSGVNLSNNSFCDIHVKAKIKVIKLKKLRNIQPSKDRSRINKVICAGKGRAAQDSLLPPFPA